MRVEELDTPRPLTLRVRLSSSELVLETWDEPRTSVTIEGVRDDRSTRELVDAFTVALRDRPHGQELTIEDPRSRVRGFGFREARALVRVRCPEGAALEATTGGGDIDLAGVLGPVEVKSGAGDVELRGSAASLRVSAASGDVDAEHVVGATSVSTASGDIVLGRVDGQLSVTAVSGDVEVRDARGGAAVQSVSGDVAIERVAGGDVRAQTVSGDVRIGVAHGVAVWVDASSVSGDLASELELEDGPPPADAEQTVYELRVRTVSGDALVRRSAPVGA